MKNRIYGTDGASFQKYVGGIDTKFLYDGANVIADYDGSNNLMASYVTPFLDQNLLVNRQTGGNWQTYYFMQDGLGSVRNLVSSVQSVANSYDYYAFGEVLSQTEGVTNRYKFTAREWDAESSTYHYRSRSYNPSVGRFNQRDPIGDIAGINLYSYVNNNPIGLTDPTGLWGLFRHGECEGGGSGGDEGDKSGSSGQLQQCLDACLATLARDMQKANEKEQSDLAEARSRHKIAWDACDQIRARPWQKISRITRIVLDITAAGCKTVVDLQLRININRIKARWSADTTRYNAEYGNCVENCRRLYAP